MKGIIVKRARVMTLLRELDPDGVESRQKKRLRRRAYHAKGPNFVWHTDGHDKLKPFGFSVNAWLYRRVFKKTVLVRGGPHKYEPTVEVIAKYYLDAVKQENDI